MLTVSDLNMRFGGLKAVDDLSFEARRGEVTAVIGPNGAGKTTVFNCITGFYRPTGGRIELHASTNGQVTIIVDDSGPGVPAEFRERVFERFVRLDEGRARDAGGSGLGLSIVAGVVRASRGTVTVDESPLGGARFTVRLPAAD